MKLNAKLQTLFAVLCLLVGSALIGGTLAPSVMADGDPQQAACEATPEDPA